MDKHHQKLGRNWLLLACVQSLYLGVLGSSEISLPAGALTHSPSCMSTIASQKRSTDRAAPSPEATKPAKKPAAVTFHEGLHRSVHAVVEVLQHEDDLVVAPVGDDGTHCADLEGREEVTRKPSALPRAVPAATLLQAV